MKKLLKTMVGLVTLLSAHTAGATLIGSQIDVSYINEGNPGGNSATSVIVQAGNADAFQFGFSSVFGFTIDIEDSMILMDCTGGFCNTTPDLGPVHYIFEGLDWGGTGSLISASLDPASDCALCLASVNLINPTSFEVVLDDNANPGPGDTLIVNLESTHVPEPSILALLGVGFLGFGFARRKRDA